jgi:hypothetical protein
MSEIQAADDSSKAERILSRGIMVCVEAVHVRAKLKAERGAIEEYDAMVPG